MEKTAHSLIDIKIFVVPVILAILLALSNQVGFLLFHTLAEFFAIVVAILASVVAWQMYAFTRNHYLMYLGCGYFSIAALDMMHALAYKGMSVFAITGVDTSVQLWIGTRYMEAVLLLSAPWFLSHTLRRNLAFSLFASVALLILLLVMSGHFPIGFIEGKGLTKFKVYSEYVIIGLLGLGIVYLSRQRQLMDRRVFVLMILSMVFTMMAELAFTFYVNLYGLSNIAGHIFKLFSFWMIFIAVVRTTLREPFSALSKAETHYDAVPDAAAIIDRQGIIQHVNKAACALTNKPAVELIGKHAHNVFHGDGTREEDCPVCQSVVNAEELSAYELKTGETSWCDFSTSIIQGENSFIEVIRDITARKQSEEALAKSSKEWALAMDFFEDAICLIGMDDKLIRANQAFYSMTGLTPALAIGHDITEIFYQRGTELAGSANSVPVFKAHKEWCDEIYILEADHADNLTGHPIQVTVQIIRDNEGTGLSVLMAIHDLSKVRAEDEENAKILHQLHQSQKMDALGNLTGGIAHDYNNMLGVIMGYAELLESALDEQPKLKKFAHEINHASHRGAKLTKKLLAFSRKKASEADILNLNALLNHAQNMLEKTLTVRIKLVLNLQEDLWSVWLDDSDMEDTILNMCINSMHAIEGSGRVTIQTSNQAIRQLDALALGLKAGDYVLLSITDTGSGMDAQSKDKIFEPFFSTKGESGTGLGLSQVYGFVQRSGGAIKVYSEPGHGTRFALYFPRYYHSGSDQQSVANHSLIEFSGNETALVVDDEPALLNLSCEMLSQHGMKVIAAECAKKALEILQSEKVDILISDIIMPDMDGYQLAAAVQEMHPEVKIQLASGFTDDRNSGMIDEMLQKNLLLKPFSTQDLLERISALLSQP